MKRHARHIQLMGKVIVKIKLTNLFDVALQTRKLLKGKPREVEIEALVDTGASGLALKPSVIKALGLRRSGKAHFRTANGRKTCGVYEPVRLDLMGRHGNFDVTDVDETVPNLLGQIPLEYLDLIVDSKGQKLGPNPEHGNEWMLEMYYRS